jgi:hypothetical protein
MLVEVETGSTLVPEPLWLAIFCTKFAGCIVSKSVFTDCAVSGQPGIAIPGMQGLWEFCCGDSTLFCGGCAKLCKERKRKIPRTEKYMNFMSFHLKRPAHAGLCRQTYASCLGSQERTKSETSCSAYIRVENSKRLLLNSAAGRGVE